ncbi:MAG: 4Fe-4S binding protein [Halobacteriota archaeon]|nr:4Fe-4S binding protein [Halobacteriota archaeon]
MIYSRPRPVIDYNLCTGCGSCIKICPRGAIEIMNIEKGFNTISRPNTSLKKKIEHIEEDLINVKNIIEKIERR